MKAKSKTALFLFSFALLLAAGPSVRAQSALDGFNPTFNGLIRTIVVQPDGKILVGGDFTMSSTSGPPPVPRNYMARLNPDGSLDTAFNPNPNGIVYSIALQADGKILAGGEFFGPNGMGGQPRNYIARLDATTGAPDSFDPNASSTVYSIAVQPDGRILAGGRFTVIGGQTRNYIARLDATTGLADSFDPNASSFIRSIVLQADGKILIGGDFNGANSVGGQSRNFIARLDGATGLADSFNPQANSTVFSISVQADGRVLAGGDFNGANSIGGQARNYIARLDAATGLADSFNPNATGSAVFAIAVQADGRILAGGQFTSIGGQPRTNMARLDASTGLADSFDPNADSGVLSCAVQADGKILVGGAFTALSPNGGAAVTRNRLARLETDGTLDQTLDLSTVGSLVFATAVQPDGKILIGGSFTTVLGVTRNNIARLNSDGTLDLSFDPNANGNVLSIAVQADGKILAGGVFNGANSIGGATRNRIARLDASSGLADSFDPNANGHVFSIAVQADGKILVGGNFSGPNSIGGATRNYIVRLDPATGSADSFDPNANMTVLSISVQADGKIVAGGGFSGPSSIGGQMRNRIARLDATTGLADSFDPNANAAVRAIVVQADGRILAGGDFSTIGGQTRSYIARLDGATGLADSFDPNANFGVLSIAVQADGKILAGGTFNGPSSIGGQTRNRIARLDATTGLADSFDPNANNDVNAITVLADGKILAGGLFSTIGGQPRSHFARLSNDIAASQNVAVTQTAITWTHGGSSPQFTRVAFEYSTDNVNYTFLDDGTAAGSNWTLSGLNFAIGQNFYIRARGYYRSGYVNGSESITESLLNAFVAPPTSAANISTRAIVGSGDNALIAGFILTGSGPKRVIIRAIGPSSGVAGALQDPTLELHSSATGALLQANDDWQSDQKQDIIDTTIPPGDPRESAIVTTLQPGAYTAIVGSKGGATGPALVEVYDLDGAGDSRLAQISTRGNVQLNDNVLIGGFIVTGSQAANVLIRGIGPELTQANVPNALQDPTLELRDNNGGLVASNDNWESDQKQAIIDTTAAPKDAREPAILESLAAGNYTAIVRGKDNSVGVALVEIYVLE